MAAGAADAAAEHRTVGRGVPAKLGNIFLRIAPPTIGMAVGGGAGAVGPLERPVSSGRTAEGVGTLAVGAGVGKEDFGRVAVGAGLGAGASGVDPGMAGGALELVEVA